MNFFDLVKFIAKVVLTLRLPLKQIAIRSMIPILENKFKTVPNHVKTKIIVKIFFQLESYYAPSLSTIFPYFWLLLIFVKYMCSWVFLFYFLFSLFHKSSWPIFHHAICNCFHPYNTDNFFIFCHQYKVFVGRHFLQWLSLAIIIVNFFCESLI